MSMPLSAARAALTIDGVDCAGEYDEIDFRIPRLVYEEVTEASFLRFLGPLGFQITVINPGERIRSLVDGGSTAHEVTVTVDGMSLTHPVAFHKEWSVGGVRRVFACLVRDPSSEPQWVSAVPAIGVDQ